MSLLAKVQAVFDASSAIKAKEDIDKLKDASPQAASAIEKLESAVSALTNPLTLMGAALASAMGYMVHLGMEAIDTADNLRDMSIGTGKAIEQLQAMQSVAEKSGSSLQAVSTGLDFISRGLAKGEEDTVKYTKALDYFNVSARDANGNLKDSATIAQEVAEAYKNTEESTSKHAAAADALGRNYKELIPTYLELNTAQDEQNYLMEVGAVVTKEQADASDEYNDTMHDVHSIMQGIGNYAAQQMLPMLIAIATQFKESATQGGLLEGVINILKVAFSALVTVAKSVVSVFIGIDTVFQAAGKALGGFGAIVDRIINKDWAGAKTVWKEMGNDIDTTFQKGGERINKMFTDIKEGAKTADEEVKKVGRGDYRSSNAPKEKALKVKVEKDPIEDANKALQGLINNLVTANKATETGSELQKMAAKIETDRYVKGNEALKQKVLLLAKEADALKASKDLQKQIADVTKVGDDTVRTLDDEVKKRKMTNAQYREYIQMRQVDLEVAAKLKEVNSNVEGADKRRQAIIEEGIRQKQRIKDANADVAKSDQDWTTGAIQGMNDYMEKVGNVANNTKELMVNSFNASEDALVKLVTTGKMDFRSLANSIIADLARMAIRALLTKAIMAAVGAFGDGAPFSGGSEVPTPHATGDIVSSPTLFPMANGNTGLMGEAGPEAIMPLKRLPSGRLGVETSGAAGGGARNISVGGIHINIEQNGSSNKVEDNAVLANIIGETVEKRLRALINEESYNQRRPGNAFNPTRVSGVF